MGTRGNETARDIMKRSREEFRREFPLYMQDLMNDQIAEMELNAENLPVGSTKEVKLRDMQGPSLGSADGGRVGTGRRIGTAYFRVGRGKEYSDTITTIELDKHLPAEAVIAAIRWADQVERSEFETRKVVTAIARGLPDDLTDDIVEGIGGPGPRDLDAEVMAAATIYRIIVGLERDDPVRWIAAVLQCDERTAQRRIAKAREKALLPPAIPGRITTRKEESK